MLATLVPQPFHRDGWVYEEKVDGWRILACKDGVEPIQPVRSIQGTRNAMTHSVNEGELDEGAQTREKIGRAGRFS